MDVSLSRNQAAGLGAKDVGDAYPPWRRGQRLRGKERRRGAGGNWKTTAFCHLGITREDMDDLREEEEGKVGGGDR